MSRFLQACAALALLFVAVPAHECTAGSETGAVPRFFKVPPAGTVLLQNQPNPASNFTVIYFYLAQSGPVSLRLYSLSGKLIGYFIDGFQSSGWYSVGFYTDFLARGEYFYRLETLSVTSVQKMLVAK